MHTASPDPIVGIALTAIPVLALSHSLTRSLLQIRRHPRTSAVLVLSAVSHGALLLWAALGLAAASGAEIDRFVDARGFLYAARLVYFAGSHTRLSLLNASLRFTPELLLRIVLSVVITAGLAVLGFTAYQGYRIDFTDAGVSGWLDVTSWWGWSAVAAEECLADFHVGHASRDGASLEIAQAAIVGGWNIALIIWDTWAAFVVLNKIIQTKRYLGETLRETMGIETHRRTSSATDVSTPGSRHITCKRRSTKLKHGAEAILPIFNPPTTRRQLSWVPSLPWMPSFTSTDTHVDLTATTTTSIDSNHVVNFDDDVTDAPAQVTRRSSWFTFAPRSPRIASAAEPDAQHLRISPPPPTREPMSARTLSALRRHLLARTHLILIAVTSATLQSLTLALSLTMPPACTPTASHDDAGAWMREVVQWAPWVVPALHVVLMAGHGRVVRGLMREGVSAPVSQGGMEDEQQGHVWNTVGDDEARMVCSERTWRRSRSVGVVGWAVAKVEGMRRRAVSVEGGRVGKVI
ncbi:hypothetical protein HK101_003976 [Irineochytrium annulatum]|nr:hypothetical protein HK101_003976 [Irineochytrium annulatum]